LEGLTFSSAFNQIYEGLNSFPSDSYCLFNWSYVDIPHVYGKIVATTGKNILSVRSTTDVCHFIGMGYKSHSFVWISI